MEFGEKNSQLLNIVELDTINRECIRILPYMIHQGILSPGSVPENTIPRVCTWKYYLQAVKCYP